MDLGLHGKVFIVTGGTGGLGLATVRQLMAEGAMVVASGRSAERVARAQAETDAARSVFLVADNAGGGTPAHLVEVVLSRWGRLDGALISVGGPPAGAATVVSDDAWRSGFETVFLGAVRLVRTFAAAMSDGGAIGLVLSVSAKAPLQEMAISNGFRPGLSALAKTFAIELAPAGVRVNALLPGPFETDRAKALAAAGTPADISKIPIGRLGQPEEFGRVAAFLLSPAASFVTGASILVDGGISPVP